MPAERPSAPDSPAIPTPHTGDIHPADVQSVLRLALILVASFMVVLDFTIVNIALPSIERDFGVATSVVQWVVTGYAIAFSGLLILGGRAADLLPAVAESMTGGIAGVTGDRAAMLTGAVAALAATTVSWQASRHARATVRSAVSRS
jgi:MFS family permease